MPRDRRMPRPSAYRLSKTGLLQMLADVDADEEASARILRMENDFRAKIRQHVVSLPTQDAQFSKFNTNPFVLMFYCLQKGYSYISEIEKSILPSKVFMSMETSAGRMVEAVTLPVYGWEFVPSEMHSVESLLDGKRLAEETLHVATLKSGPRCLNDEMSSNIADDIIAHARHWAEDAGVDAIEFTYGVLYGTRKQSNKKDWHILRNLRDKLPSGSVTIQPDHRWECAFEQDGLSVHVTVRIGVELWKHIARLGTALVELCAALIRACVAPSDTDPEDYEYTIRDLQDIVSLDVVPDGYNVSILQYSQLEWVFFFARHFCDELVPRDLSAL